MNAHLIEVQRARERAWHDGEEDRRDRFMENLRKVREEAVTLDALREYDPAAQRAWAFAGTTYPDALCPICKCPKSGSSEVPNSPSETCEDRRCRCHDEDPE